MSIPSPGTAGGGILWTIVVGILGSMLGGWIGTQMGFGSVNGFDLRSLNLRSLDLRSLGVAILGSIGRKR